MSGVAIKNFTRRHLEVWADVPFAKITEEVLPGWDVSLALVGAEKARELNKRLRGKTYVPNVLSYVAGEKSAEIILCPSAAVREASSHGLAPRAYCLLLFIHAALHIKGWVHGATMEKCERKLLARYETTHSDGNRRRHTPGKSGRRRGTLR